MMIGCGVNVWEPNGGRILPESVIGGGAPTFLYDMTRGYTDGVRWVNQASGSIAADNLVSAAWPIYQASNPLLGNRPSVTGVPLSSAYLQSQTPANATVLAQPSTWFVIGIFTGNSGAFYWDSAVNGWRNLMSRVLGNVSIYAGTSQNTYAIAGTPALIMSRFWGAQTTSTRRTAGGEVTSGLVNAGVQSCKGITLCTGYNLSGFSDATFTLIMAFPGDRTSSWNAMKAWAARYAGIA